MLFIYNPSLAAPNVRKIPKVIEYNHLLNRSQESGVRSQEEGRRKKESF
jgi:hypothetical protein